MHARVSDLADPMDACDFAPTSIAFRLWDLRRHSDFRTFRGSTAGLHVPRSTLHVQRAVRYAQNKCNGVHAGPSPATNFMIGDVVDAKTNEATPEDHGERRGIPHIIGA